MKNLTMQDWKFCEHMYTRTERLLRRGVSQEQIDNALDSLEHYELPSKLDWDQVINNFVNKLADNIRRNCEKTNRNGR